MAKASKKYKASREKMGYPIGPNSKSKQGPKTSNSHKSKDLKNPEKKQAY